MRRIPRCPRSVRHRWQFGVYPAILFAMIGAPAETWSLLHYPGLAVVGLVLATVQLWASWSSLRDSRGDLRLAAVGVGQLYAIYQNAMA